jgi:hypothetical protein
MRTHPTVRLTAIALFAALAACGPQKHENQAHENIARGGGHHGIRAICAADIEKFCAQADRPRRCLKQNIDKLSDACKAAVAKRHGGRNRDNDSDNDDQK